MRAFPTRRRVNPLSGENVQTGEKDCVPLDRTSIKGRAVPCPFAILLIPATHALISSTAHPMKSILSHNVLGIAITTLVSATSPYPPPIGGPFLNCATGTTDMNITSFVLEPRSPCIGKEVCIIANGTLSVPITAGGNTTVIGRYLRKIAYSQKSDLMDGLVAQGYPNPVPATVSSVKYCFTVKPSLPIVS